jgi:CubicO group peptidase (beta-lactamase class C family)
MSIRRLAVVLLALLAGSAALAAPDEEILGRDEGYPVCPLGPSEQRCLVGQYSHFDQIVPARSIQRAAVPRALPTAPFGETALLEEFLAHNRDTGLLVMKDGAVLFERYQYARKAEDRFTSMSMAKTVVSMLLGIALAEKKIASIDDRAEQYVPGLKGHPYGETRLRDLLTMSSGVRFVENYDGNDDVAVLVRKTFRQEGPGGVDTVISFRERARPAGEAFSYASAETEVLGLVLRAAVGKPLAEYLSEKIWQPMGAEADATWLIDAGGYEIAYCCINARLRDWARLGDLLAHDGALDGRQIIPADWVRAATRPDSPHLAYGVATTYSGYGYQVWLISPEGRRFALFGVRGQAVFVDPQSKLVVVHTAVHALPRDVDARRAQFVLWNTLRARLAR